MVTAELLKTTVSGANSVPEYLLQAGEVERERLRVRSKEINSTSTYRQSKTTQLNLRQFHRIPRDEGHRLFRTSPKSSPNRSRSFSRKSWDTGTDT